MQGYETHCGRTTWSVERGNNGNMHANRQGCCCRAAGTVSTKRFDISFILDSMAMKIYRDMGKYMIHLWIKGIVKWSCGLPRICMPIGKDVAA